MRGGDFLSSSDASPATVAFLQALGVSADQVGVAFGIGVDAATGTGVVMFAFQAAGVEQSRLVSTFKAASNRTGSAPYHWRPVTVGGKAVEVTTDPSQPGIKLYLYAHGDVLFLIGASSETQVAEALGRLP